jgi:hypothetical protein
MEVRELSRSQRRTMDLVELEEAGCRVFKNDDLDRTRLGRRGGSFGPRKARSPRARLAERASPAGRPTASTNNTNHPTT